MFSYSQCCAESRGSEGWRCVEHTSWCDLAYSDVLGSRDIWVQSSRCSNRDL